MRKDSAQLPVDFLVGFTIFILSLIMVANFVPSLLVGLQRTSGIDYDAVAYRTGVVLAEDPGETNLPQVPEFPIGGDPTPYDVNYVWQPWELRTDKEQVSRFGLALARDTPSVLSINKINRFFGKTSFSFGPGLDDNFDSPTNDYRSKLLFSSYQYGYNITLQNISPMKPGEPFLKVSRGEPYPAGYGYIRRYVVVKQNSNATLNIAGTNPYYNTYPGNEALICLPPDCSEQLTIRLNGTILYNRTIDTPFKIDLQREPLIMHITGLSNLLNNSANNPSALTQFGYANWATLREVDFEFSGFKTTAVPGNVKSYISNGSAAGTPGNQTLPLTTGIAVTDTLSLYLEYIDAGFFHPGRDLDITFKFVDYDATDPPTPIPYTLLHGDFLYDYNTTNVTQPYLSTGMLEVGIW